MVFKRVISREGHEIRLNDEHEIFKIPIFQELNYDEPIDISYTDLDMLISKQPNYSILSKEEIINHLELLDKICHVKRQKEVLDYVIANYQEDMKEWEQFVNPSVINIAPEYLIKFPNQIDNNLETFFKLKGYNNIKREKLLQYARDNNIDSFTILFDKSIITGKFRSEIIKYGIKFVKIISEKGFDDWDQVMCDAAFEGDKDLVDFFIIKGANDWNCGMYGAAEGGHKELVEFFIEKGANDWNRGMNYAAKGGHKNLVDFFIEKGADNLDECMMYAAYGEHKDLIELFIEKGAKRLDWGIKGAVTGGHIDLFIFLVHKRSQEKHLIDSLACDINFWNMLMNNAAEIGNKELVLFFIDRGCNDFNSGMKWAAKGGHKDLVELFIEKGANYWNLGLVGAAQGGHKELIDFFIEKGADDFYGALYAAKEGDDIEIINFFNEKIFNNQIGNRFYGR